MKSSFLQRDSASLLPYDGHVTSGVVRLKDGSLLAMGRMHGLPHELASRADRNTASRSLNTLWRNIADDNVTAYSHFVRRRVDHDRPRPTFYSDFGEKFDRKYRDLVLRDLYQNNWFLSIVVSPRLVPVGTEKFRSQAMKLLKRSKLAGSRADADILQLEEIWTQLSRGLADYGIERLRLRDFPRTHWDFEPELASEIAEALHMILTADFAAKPLLAGPLGDVVYTDHTIFERRIHRVLPPGVDDDSYDGPGTRWGVIFGFRRYMGSTRPNVFDQILRLPMELVMSQSFSFMSQASSVARLSLKRDQMRVAQDPGRKETRQLRRAASEVGGGEVVRGVHHFSLAVYADSYRDLVRKAGLARTALANSGAVVVPETAGNESSWWAQLPGNFYWRTRPAGASSRNWADFSHFGASPVGAREGRWGPAGITFRTTAGTAYDFVPHVGVGDDVGMTAFFGPTGAGKTVALGSLVVMYDSLIGEGGRQFLFDKDSGLELLVRAMRGSYLQIRLGEPSGMAPLRALENTPADRQFLSRLIRAMIDLDELGPIPPEDHARIARGVAAIMRKPPHLRTFAGLRQYLGWKNPLGAGPRLEARWVSGAELGWMFDGDEDVVDVDSRLVGFDLTALLDVSELAAIAGQYLLYRINSAMDGRRVVINMDEARFYIFHDLFRDRAEDWLGTGRKKELIFNICAQQPEHLLKGSFGVMMVNQCQTKIALPNGNADKKIYCDVMHFTEGEYFAVHEGMHSKSHQFLIQRADGSVIVDFDLSEMPEYLAVLSGRATTVRDAAKLRSDSSEDWVERFMGAYATDSTTRHATTQHGTSQHNTTQHTTSRHTTPHNNTSPHTTAQHVTTQHDTTQEAAE